MKRFIRYAIAGTVVCLCIVYCRTAYLRLYAPTKLIDIAERNGGWVDDSIPLKRIRIERRMDPADGAALLANLPRLRGMLEISLAESSPDAKWIAGNIDLNQMRRLSINGSSAGSAMSNTALLVDMSKNLEELKIYNSRFSPEERDKLQELCAPKGIRVSHFPQP